jgi:hypothetical protein
MWHVFETLYTFDKDWSPIPHLAEGHTVTDGGRQYTIMLRRGVRFHNGKEMTSIDVVASLNRWGRMAIVGKALWKSVEGVDAKGSSRSSFTSRSLPESFLTGSPSLGTALSSIPRRSSTRPATGSSHRRNLYVAVAPPSPWARISTVLPAANATRSARWKTAGGAISVAQLAREAERELRLRAESAEPAERSV